jgi:sarcosine oxidase subunit beta
MEQFDVIVIGGGAIGVSIAYHLARLGCPRTLLLERGQLGSGTKAQSSCLIRTHYSVPENVALANAGLAVFREFAGYLDDPEADAGFTQCGTLIVAGAGPRADALRDTLAVERNVGIDAREIAADDARRILPLPRHSRRPASPRHGPASTT